MKKYLFPWILKPRDRFRGSLACFRLEREVNKLSLEELDIKAYFMGKTGSKWGETTKKQVKEKFPSTQKHTHNALDDALEQAEIFEKMNCKLE